MKKFIFVVTLLGLVFLPSIGQAKEVNVYSYRQGFLMAPLFSAFTEETGIKVNTVFAKAGLVERLIQEADNSPADILMTVDVGRLADARNANVIQAVQSQIIMQNIPKQYRDADGYWFGLTKRARMIVAAKDRIDVNQLKTYADLADEKFAGKVCTRSGKHSYMVALTASVIAHEGEKATQAWLKGLKNNLARKPQGNDRAQVKAIKEGECDIALINSYYMGKMMNDSKNEQQAWAEAVNVIFPNQDDRGTHVNVSGMALTKAAPNRSAAIKLMEFLSSDEGQQIYAQDNYEYPVKPGVAWSDLVASWGKFKADDLALAKIAQYRTAASKLVDIVDYDE